MDSTSSLRFDSQPGAHARIGMGADRRSTIDLHRHAKGPNLTRRERALSLAAGGALLLYAGRRSGWTRAASGAAGALLAARGASGHCAIRRALGRRAAPSRGVALEIGRAITVQAQPDAVRRFVEDPRRIESLRFFEEVEPIGPEKWRVAARLPRVGRREWEVALVEQADQLEWRSEAGAPFEHALRLSMAPAPADRGTEITATFCVAAPGGAIATALGRSFEGVAERALGHELAHLKQCIEAGEIATTESQPAGRRSARQRIARRLLANREANR